MGYGNALYPLAALGASFGNNLIEGPWYGNFVGPGPDGPNANPYMLSDPNNAGEVLKPIDLIDRAAQVHDDYYWKHGLSGVESALFSLEALPADIALVNAA